MSSKPNYIIVLNALMSKPGERIIKLPTGIEVGWLNNKLHYIMYSKEDEIWYEFDISINSFITNCEIFSDADIVSIVAGTALSKAKKERVSK